EEPDGPSESRARRRGPETSLARSELPARRQETLRDLFDLVLNILQRIRISENFCIAVAAWGDEDVELDCAKGFHVTRSLLSRPDRERSPRASRCPIERRRSSPPSRSRGQRARDHRRNRRDRLYSSRTSHRRALACARRVRADRVLAAACARETRIRTPTLPFSI